MPGDSDGSIATAIDMQAIVKLRTQLVNYVFPVSIPYCKVLIKRIANS